MAERYDTKFNIKLCGFQPQPQASYVSSHIEELRYNETVCLWMTVSLNHNSWKIMKKISRTSSDLMDTKQKLSIWSEEVLLFFFVFFDFIKNTLQDGNKFIILMWLVLLFLKEIIAL